MKEKHVQRQDGNRLEGPVPANTARALADNARLKSMGDLEGRAVFPHVNVDPQILRFGLRLEVYVEGKGRQDGTGFVFSMELGRGGTVFKAHTKDPRMKDAEMRMHLGDQPKPVTHTFEGVCPDGLGFGFVIPPGTKGPLVIEKVKMKRG